MEKETTLIYGLDELDTVAQHIIGLFNGCQVFAITGSLGAGKTTLVQRILRQAGVEGVIMSPTFTYVNRYTNNKGQTFYHFDCYRIGSLNEFIQLGFDEYLYQPHSWSFIEWPEVVSPLLKHKACTIALEYYTDDKRKLTYTLQR